MASRSFHALCATASILAIAAATPATAQQAGGTTELEQINVEGQGQGGQAGGGGRGAGEVGAPSGGTPGVATADGYVAKTTRSATKTDTPVHETPQTINTVTQKQLEDQQPQNLQEALAYTPGVRGGAFGFDPRYDSFFIRGVDVTYTGVFRDGLRQFNSPNGLFRLEPYGLESISILKGPASAIYGASSSAGIIDLVSKRPTDYKFGEIESQSGSFNRIQSNFDFGGPANEEGTVLYRMTGLARRADTELGAAVKDDRAFFAPSITLKPSDDTKLTVLGEFMDATTGGSAAYNNNYGLLFDKNGNPVFGKEDFDGDGKPDQLTGSYGANKNFGPTAKYNDFNQKQGRVGYEFEHAFTDRVSVHQNLRYSGVETDQQYSFFDDFDGYSRGLVKEENRALGVDTYLKAKVDTGPLRHTLLAGVDYGRLRFKSLQGDDYTAANLAQFSDPDLTDRFRQRQSITGTYVQDEIALDRWRLLLGGRKDWLDSSFKSDVPNPTFDPTQPTGPNNPERLKATNRQNESEFTGRVALSYVAPNGLTPYASYGTSFNANSGTVINAGVAKPTRGETAEAGLKYAVPDYNATINGSVFWLKQVDGVIFDASSGLNQQVQADFTSRGAEIDAAASLANGVNLIASYSYTKTKILKLSELAEGNEISGIPNHAVKFWAGYAFKSGPAKGLEIGGGVRYEGKSFGDDLNRAVIANKARAFVDARASYELENINPKLKGFKVQVNAQNLFDKVEQVCSQGYCYYDKGRQVIASVKYRW